MQTSVKLFGNRSRKERFADNRGYQPRGAYTETESIWTLGIAWTGDAVARQDLRSSQESLFKVMRNASSQVVTFDDALSRLSKEFYATNESNPEAFRAALAAFCLANWKRIEPLFIAETNYCVDEGLHQQEYWLEKTKANFRRAKR